MIYLLDFNPIKPDFGLFFWSLLTFIIFWTVVAKFAFRPIANALKKRAAHIQDALDASKKARQEMEKLKSENEKLLEEARKERAVILKEAKDTSNSIINEARNKAKTEANKIVENAKLEIEKEKLNAIKEVKKNVGLIAVDLTEKLLGKQLHSKDEQVKFVQSQIDKLNLN